MIRQVFPNNSKRTLVNITKVNDSLLLYKITVLWTLELLWKNYGTYYGKNYGKNYGTILKTIKLRFTKEDNMVDYPKLRNFDLLWEKWYYPKTIKDFEHIYSFRWK